MNATQQRLYLVLAEVARDYERIRAVLVAAQEDALEQARISALQIVLTELEALRVHELLRELEGDEEFIASSTENP
jgi:hypothetical protein